jgi:hypothetical protein
MIEQDTARLLAATCRPNTSAAAIPSPLFLLKELNDEVHLLLNTVDPVVQSVHPFSEFTDDSGLGRLGVSDFSGRNDG